MRTPAAGLPPLGRTTPEDSCQIVLLGALGCRYGMLAGGAGGHLVRTATTTVLVDPGPAALGLLLQLRDQGVFDWRELDAIAVTHLHPDHYVDLIPCLEAAASYAPPEKRVVVLANPTAAARFAAFSPYHLGGMADLITLAHPTTDGTGQPSATVGEITLHATPALHLEEAGRTHSAIGLAYTCPAADIWYTSDTSLAPDLLDHVAAITPRPDLVIAHADASNLDQTAERTAACHLEGRDVPAIAAALKPSCVLIQHYDAAYSEPRYRVAQAVWIQRQLNGTTVLPGASGLQLTLAVHRFHQRHLLPGADDSSAMKSYLNPGSAAYHPEER